MSRRTKVSVLASLGVAALVATMIGLVAYPSGASKAPVELETAFHADHEHGVQGEPVKPVRSFELSELRRRAPSDTPVTDTPAGEAQRVSLVADVSRTFPFVWPAFGNLTSYMGPEHPLGIDIGLDHGSISPITAMARGTVSLAGGNPEVGYGYFVTVDHGNGLVTLYGHFSEILVRQGQAVEQGEVLGYGGSTGKSTGKHLHFEVRHQGYLVDPLDLLPEDRSDPANLSLDCERDALVVDRGSVARLDFAKSLPQGSEIGQVTLTPVGGGEAGLASAEVTAAGVVVIDTPPGLSLSASEYEDTYILEVVLNGLAAPTTSECEIQVRTRSSAPTAFVHTPDPYPSGSAASGSASLADDTHEDALTSFTSPDAGALEDFESQELVSEETPQETPVDGALPDEGLVDESGEATPEGTEVLEEPMAPGDVPPLAPLDATPTVESFAAPTFETPTSEPGTSTPSPSPSATPTETLPTPTSSPVPTSTLAPPIPTAEAPTVLPPASPTATNTPATEATPD